MALPVITDVYRCTLNWATAANVAPRNVLHIRASSTTEALVGAALLAALGNASSDTECWNTMIASHVLNSVTILALDGSSASAIVNTVGGTIKGGQTAGDVIPQSCCLVSLRTSQRGPRGRGRVYTGPLAEAIHSNGQINTTNVTAQQGGWNALLTNLPLQTPALHLCVASYVHGDSHDVTSLTVEGVVATQRRRLAALR